MEERFERLDVAVPYLLHQHDVGIAPPLGCLTLVLCKEGQIVGFGSRDFVDCLGSHLSVPLARLEQQDQGQRWGATNHLKTVEKKFFRPAVSRQSQVIPSNEL